MLGMLQLCLNIFTTPHPKKMPIMAVQIKYLPNKFLIQKELIIALIGKDPETKSDLVKLHA